jgi:hypothetical protein
VTDIKLHLDADTSLRALHEGLLLRGHNVTRTPCDWMPADASDEDQLLRSTAQGRALFTFNVRDFMALAQRYPAHAGIIVAAQRRWTLSSLLRGLDHFLSSNTAEQVAGRVVWLPRPGPDDPLPG